MENTLFKKVSIGVVAKDIVVGSVQLEVIPIESNGYLNGEYAHGDQTLSAKGADSTGLEYQKSITTSTAVTAIWYPGTSNQLNPPMMSVGEYVTLYRYANTDDYYWSADGQSDHLRPTDTIGSRISAKGTKDESPLNADNSYFWEMSSAKKRISLRTSKANGEVCIFQAQLDLAEGFFELSSDTGLLIQLSIENDSFAIQNQAGTRVEATGGLLECEATEKILLKAPDFEVDTDKGTINAKQLTLAGSNLAINYSVGKSSGGNFTWAGKHAYTGTITHMGIDIGAMHKHMGVKSGPSVSGTVV